MKSKAAVILVLVLTSFFTISKPSQAQDYSAVERAKQLLSTNASSVLGVAHSTTSYRSAQFHRAQPLREGGFLLCMRVHFVDMWGSAGYSDLDFYFHANGSFWDAGKGVSNTGWPAYAASTLVFEGLRYSILEDRSLSRQDRAIIRAIPDAKSLLKYSLKLEDLLN